MNSLIKLPSSVNGNLSTAIDIMIEDSSFKRISTCGALISNNEQLNFTGSLKYTESVSFTQETILKYSQFLDYARQ